jgi:hypothetical protein
MVRIRGWFARSVCAAAQARKHPLVRYRQGMSLPKNLLVQRQRWERKSCRLSHL